MILSYPDTTLKVIKGIGEINLNNIFYLTQYNQYHFIMLHFLP